MDLNVVSEITSMDSTDIDYPTMVNITVKNSDDETLYGCIKTPPTGVYPVLTDYLKTAYVPNGSYDSSLYNSSISENTSTRISTITYKTKLNNANYENCRIYVDITNPSGLNTTIESYSLKLYDLNDNLIDTIIETGTTISSGGITEINFVLVDIENVYVETTVTYSYSATVKWETQNVGDYAFLYVPASTTITLTSSVYLANTTDVNILVCLACNYTSSRAWSFLAICDDEPTTGTIKSNSTYSLSLSYSNVVYDEDYSLYYIYSNGSFASNVVNRYCSALVYNNAGWFSPVNMFSSSYLPTIFSALTSTNFPYTNYLSTYDGLILGYNTRVNISTTFPGKSNEVEGGTEGTFDDTTDTVALPSLPTTDQVLIDDGKSVNSFSIFLLSSNGYRYVRQCLFSTDFFTNIKNYFTKPMDGIVAVGRFPFTPPTSHPGYPIYIGSVALEYNNTIAVGDAINRYQTYDCGSIQILPYWDTALDYNPYTQVIINLPFIGRKQLNTDLVMGKTIHVIYHVDMVTGGCIAYILADDDLIEQFTGNMMTVAPLSGEDFSRVYGALLTSVASSSVSAFGSGSPGTALAGAVTGVANTALHSKRDFSGNTNLGGSTSLMENLQPFVEIIRPVQSRPRNYKKFKGYVSTVTEVLSNCTGYTEVMDIHLDNIPATDTEKDEISALLHSGVII